MKRLTLTICICAAIAVAGVAFELYRQGLKGSIAEERQRVTPASSSSDIEHHSEESSLSIGLSPISTKNPSSIADAFSESRNYLQFARATIEAARSGNPDAQYYLGKALRVCEDSRSIFRFNSQAIDLNEALSHYSSGQNSARKITAIYERCHDLEAVGDRIKEFGNPEDWIKSASDHGQPVAQSDEALKGLSAIQKGAMTATGDFNALTKSGIDPRSLLLAAVQTKDPEALFNVGQAQGYLNNFNGEATKSELAWWLVACQRGLPCDSDSEFQRDVALNDSLSGLTGPDLICMMAGKDCQEVERQAQEINEKLNAGEWDQLGLQSRCTPADAKGPLISDTTQVSEPS
jgi:hypothetical protein